MTGSTESHRTQAADHAETREVRCAVLTISDTRTLETDKGGDTVVAELEAGGHAVVARALVPDEAVDIRAKLFELLADPEVQAVITTGGTGIANRDTTIDVAREVMTIELEGFGELFRMLSYEEVGAAAMLSRATAGLVCPNDEAIGETFLFCLPGSTNAVWLGMRKLIVPELSHLVWERQR
ncbi:MAG: molybdenum cofactor biosynthesis protein B [Phycisphaerales bacterium JB038]